MCHILLIVFKQYTYEDNAKRRSAGAGAEDYDNQHEINELR